MRKHAIAALLILNVAAVPSFAQRMGGAGRRSISSFGPAREARFPRSLYLGTPLWFDDYPPNDNVAPSVIVVQAPAQPAASARPVFEETKSAAPLLIEWQGDRYVRRTTGTATETNPAPLDYSASTKGNSAVHPAPSVSPANPLSPSIPEPAPATFVFRDGHREQSSDYTIVSGVIYTRGDYWTSGSWTRKIPIAQLDVPATLRANADNRVPFRLPSAPNEIITRP
jgi:hypothetical protein